VPDVTNPTDGHNTNNTHNSFFIASSRLRNAPQSQNLHSFAAATLTPIRVLQSGARPG
jgi:hypothetical protein